MSAPALKIFVINLERAADRRAHMQDLLCALGLKAEFVRAVDGRALSSSDRSQYDSRLARLNYRSEMTDTEIACYLSHYRIYERICREKLPLALILEDDVDIAPNFVTAIDALAAQPNPQWTVVRLQTLRRKLLEPDCALTHGRLVGELGESGLFRLDTHVLGGCAYLMRLPAAQTMLTYGRIISRPIDQTLDRFWENGIVPYVVRPFPARQHHGFGSQIGVRGKAAYVEEKRVDAVRGRLIRARDGINKRMFRLALHRPWLSDLAALSLPWPARRSLRELAKARGAAVI
jgi:glycosyl transferase family 25